MRTVALAVALVTGTALFAGDVRTNFDRDTDFSQYKTYSWIAERSRGPWANQIREGVDAQLAAKGWTKVAAGGETTVSAFSRVQPRETFSTYYDGFHNDWMWGKAPGAAVSTTDIPVGSLLIDFFDGKTKKLIWRGSAGDVFPGESSKEEDRLKTSLEEMFKEFPRTHPAGGSPE